MGQFSSEQSYNLESPCSTPGGTQNSYSTQDFGCQNLASNSGQAQFSVSTQNFDPQCSSPAKSPELRDGCTVEGHTTGQNFSTVYLDYETDYVSLKLFLQGFVPQPQQGSQHLSTRETNKDLKVKELEAENEELRRKLAELENQRLKAELAQLQLKAELARQQHS